MSTPACESCGKEAYGRVRITVARAGSDALPPEHQAHAGLSATRVLCTSCLHDRVIQPYLAIRWLEQVGPALEYGKRLAAWRAVEPSAALVCTANTELLQLRYAQPR